MKKDDKKGSEVSDQRTKDAAEIVQKLADFVNNMSHSKEMFADYVMTQHRTLQQQIFALMVECIRRWAEAELHGLYDLRNEDTVLMSKRLHEVLDREFSGGGVRFI